MLAFLSSRTHHPHNLPRDNAYALISVACDVNVANSLIPGAAFTSCTPKTLHHPGNLSLATGYQRTLLLSCNKRSKFVSNQLST
jgi:hypothetical protein